MSEALNPALEFFCNKYEPANMATASDFFTSRFIQSLIYNHTGIQIELMELDSLLKGMGYACELLDGELRWLVKC